MASFKKIKRIYFIAAVLIVLQFSAYLPVGLVLAANDVSVSENTDLELNTADTAVLTTIVASAGGQVTNFDVESNYIDITLDNLSTVTFTTIGGQYLKITKQSGSNDYTLNPTCPTNTVTMAGTGITAILRLEVLTTNQCTTAPPPSSGGGSRGRGLTSIVSTPLSQMSVCQFVELLINISAIVPGKANQARVALKCTAPTPIPVICPPYLTRYIKLGAQNDVSEVKKLQSFLIKYEGFSKLAVNGIYDQATYEAVKVFQSRYAQDILVPWGFTAPTGYIYTTTIKKINEIYCQKTQSVCQFVELLIKIGAITSDKASLARAALKCSL